MSKRLPLLKRGFRSFLRPCRANGDGFTPAGAVRDSDGVVQVATVPNPRPCRGISVMVSWIFCMLVFLISSELSYEDIARIESSVAEDLCPSFGMHAPPLGNGIEFYIRNSTTNGTDLNATGSTFVGVDLPHVHSAPSPPSGPSPMPHRPTSKPSPPFIPRQSSSGLVFHSQSSGEIWITSSHFQIFRGFVGDYISWSLRQVAQALVVDSGAVSIPTRSASYGNSGAIALPTGASDGFDVAAAGDTTLIGDNVVGQGGSVSETAGDVVDAPSGDTRGDIPLDGGDSDAYATHPVATPRFLSQLYLLRGSYYQALRYQAYDPNRIHRRVVASAGGTPHAHTRVLDRPFSFNFRLNPATGEFERYRFDLASGQYRRESDGALWGEIWHVKRCQDADGGDENGCSSAIDDRHFSFLQSAAQDFIFVRPMNGRPFPIPYKSDATVANIKVKIQEVLGTPTEEQRLSFSCKRMDKDTYLLSDYNVVKGSTLNMNLRLLAGQPHPFGPSNQGYPVYNDNVQGQPQPQDFLNNICQAQTRLPLSQMDFTQTGLLQNSLFGQHVGPAQNGQQFNAGSQCAGVNAVLPGAVSESNQHVAAPILAPTSFGSSFGSLRGILPWNTNMIRPNQFGRMAAAPNHVGRVALTQAEAGAITGPRHLTTAVGGQWATGNEAAALGQGTTGPSNNDATQRVGVIGTGVSLVREVIQRISPRKDGRGRQKGSKRGHVDPDRLNRMILLWFSDPQMESQAKFLKDSDEYDYNKDKNALQRGIKSVDKLSIAKLSELRRQYDGGKNPLLLLEAKKMIDAAFPLTSIYPTTDGPSRLSASADRDSPAQIDPAMGGSAQILVNEEIETPHAKGQISETAALESLDDHPLEVTFPEPRKLNLDLSDIQGEDDASSLGSVAVDADGYPVEEPPEEDDEDEDELPTAGVDDDGSPLEEAPEIGEEGNEEEFPSSSNLPQSPLTVGSSSQQNNFFSPQSPMSTSSTPKLRRLRSLLSSSSRKSSPIAMGSPMSTCTSIQQSPMSTAHTMSRTFWLSSRKLPSSRKSQSPMSTSTTISGSPGIIHSCGGRRQDMPVDTQSNLSDSRSSFSDRSGSSGGSRSSGSGYSEHSDERSVESLIRRGGDGRMKNGRKKGSKCPHLKSDDMQRCIMDWYKSGTAVFRWCARNRKLTEYGSIAKHISRISVESPIGEGESIDRISIRKAKKNKVREDVVDRAVTEYFQRVEGNKKKRMGELHKSLRILSDNDSDVVAQIAAEMSLIGHAFSPKEFGDFLYEWIQKDANDDESIVRPSDTTIRRILDRAENLKAATRASSVDIQRAQKANDLTRRCWFLKLQSQLELLRTLGHIPDDWIEDGKTDWNLVPRQNIFNFDELSSDTAARWSKVIVSKDHIKAGKRICVVSRIGDNGKQPFHVTVGLFTSASGLYANPQEGLEGAPPPVVIHSRPSAKKNKVLTTKVMEEAGLIEPDGEGGIAKVHGIDVWATKNGSMEKSRFMDLADHFLDNMPSHIGPISEGKTPAILFLDGHASRWDFAAIFKLYQRGVFLVCLPSHTSIWSQPNDRGPNKKLHEFVKEATREWKGSTFDRRDFNKIFQKAWRRFIDAEHAELMGKEPSNTAMRAYETTGLRPFDPHSEAWTDAVETLGMNRIVGARFDSSDEAGWEPFPKVGAPPVSEEHRNLFIRSISEESLKAYITRDGHEITGASAALHLCWQMIARHRSSLTTARPSERPTGLDKAEKLVLSTYYDIKSTDDDDTFVVRHQETAEESERRRRTNIINLTKQGHSVNIIRKEDNRHGQAALVAKGIGVWSISWTLTQDDLDINNQPLDHVKPVTVLADVLLDADKYGIEARTDGVDEAAKRAASRATARRNKRERDRAEDNARDMVEQDRDEAVMAKMQEFINEVIAVQNAASEGEEVNLSQNPVILKKIEEVDALCSNPFEREYNGIKVVASAGSTSAAWVCAQATLEASASRFHIQNGRKEKSKSRSKRTTPSTHHGMGTIDLLFFMLNQIRDEYIIENAVMESDEIAKAEQLKAFMEKLESIESTRPGQSWWKVADAKPKLKKAELVTLANLFGVTMAAGSGSGKKGTFLVSDWERALIAKDLSDDIVKAKWEELTKELQAIRDSRQHRTRRIGIAPLDDDSSGDEFDMNSETSISDRHQSTKHPQFFDDSEDEEYVHKSRDESKGRRRILEEVESESEDGISGCIRDEGDEIPSQARVREDESCVFADSSAPTIRKRKATSAPETNYDDDCGDDIDQNENAPTCCAGSSCRERSANALFTSCFYCKGQLHKNCCIYVRVRGTSDKKVCQPCKSAKGDARKRRRLGDNKDVGTGIRKAISIPTRSASYGTSGAIALPTGASAGCSDTAGAGDATLIIANDVVGQGGSASETTGDVLDAPSSDTRGDLPLDGGDSNDLTGGLGSRSARSSSRRKSQRRRNVNYGEGSYSSENISGGDYIGQRVTVYRTNRKTGKDQYFNGSVIRFGPDPKNAFKDGWTIKFDDEIVVVIAGGYGYEEDFCLSELKDGIGMYEDVGQYNDNHD